jgi:3-hydroxy-9,10-secoandrosta-1,3,5(10)-triene-9,17-dione monooxygenase reductase component
MPVSGDLYKKMGRAAAGPVCVVAAHDRVTGSIAGLTASSFVTLSLDPPMVMFALQQSADSYATIVASKAFGVSLLSRRQSRVASLFARKGRAKYGSVSFTHGRALHVPLVPCSLAHIECLTSQVYPSGDHAIVVGVVEAAQTIAGEPLLYFDGKYGSFTSLPDVPVARGEGRGV